MNLMLMQGNAKTIALADESVHCVVTSPPYWGLRDYGIGGQLGLEPTPEQFVANMVAVFREIKRVLRSDGTCWLNLGDSYAGNREKSGNAGPHATCGNTKKEVCAKVNKVVGDLKPKDLCGIPWRVAFALQADGWWLRSDIIWSKPNPMPESVTDRPTKAHEYLFLLTKSARYYYDADAVREKANPDTQRGTPAPNVTESVGNMGGNKRTDFEKNRHKVSNRNRRTVWHIATAPYSGAHFATYPPALVEPCIKAGTSEHGVCPECGAPWERVVERGNSEHHCRPGCSCQASKQTEQDWSEGWQKYGNYQNTAIATNRWQPTCECVSHDPIPATVFDPFAGSGTTLQVARALGRNGVGLDLSHEYLGLARKRLSLDAWDAWTDGGKADGNGVDTAHKNKQVPGRQTHSFHEARNEKGVTDLPMFEELG